MQITLNNQINIMTADAMVSFTVVNNRQGSTV